MIIKEIINGMVFLEQRIYYIYSSEEEWKRGHSTICMSDEKRFIENKELAKEKETKGDRENKFIVF